MLIRITPSISQSTAKPSSVSQQLAPYYSGPSSLTPLLEDLPLHVNWVSPTSLRMKFSCYIHVVCP